MHRVYSSLISAIPFTAKCSGYSECAEIAETDLGISWLLFEPAYPAFWELCNNN